MLSGIQISKGNDAVINLLNVPADTYIVSAEIIADTAPAVEMTVSVDGSTPVNMTLNPNMYNAYTAPITVGMNSHSITLSTSYESTISINLNLYPEVETTALPTSTPDDFSAYEVKTYSYTAAKTGYQVLVPTATPSASSFSIVYKNSPNDFGGETLGENYPIYMEQNIGNLVSGTYNVEIEGDMVAVVANGATYSDGKLVVRASAGKYALVSLTFTSETAQTVTVTITETVDGTMTVGTPQSIALSYYDDTVSYSIELTPGVYRIDLSNVKHTGENEAYWMVSVNDNYIMFGTTSAIFEIAEEGIYTITFMYYDMDSVSFDATISLVPERMLVLGESKQITLAAESNENYYINLETGAYAITLTFTDGSQIQVLLNGGEIIGGGATSAEFVITSNGYYIFTFANLATANTTFSVVITVLE